MSITVYGCVTFPAGTITFENLETCLAQSACIVFEGVHAGQVALTLSGATNNAACNDTFYGCINFATGKFQVVIPESCCAPFYKSVWKLNSNGELVWVYDTGGITRGIAIDSLENVYVVGNRINNRSVWKLNSSGQLLWYYDTGHTTFGVAVDFAGNVYVAGNEVNSKTVWCLNSIGQLVWDYNTTGFAYGIALSSITEAPFVYVVGSGGLYPYGPVLWKFNPGGQFLWNITTGQPYARCVTAQGENIYIGQVEGNVSIQKYNGAGTLIWSLPGSEKHGIATDGNVCIAGIRLYSESVWKKDSSSNPIWAYDTEGSTKGIAIDSFGNVYVAGDWVNSKSVWKLNSSGQLLWYYETGISKSTLGIATNGGSVFIAGERTT